MYYAHWVFAIIVAVTGENRTGEVVRQVPMLHSACEAFVAKHEADMPAYVIGYSQEDPESEALVRGNCIPVAESPAL
jgi:cytochrome bd-type quinol oxidase subunit 1